MKNCASATILPDGADPKEIKKDARNILNELIRIKAHNMTNSKFTGKNDYIFCEGMDILDRFINSTDDG